MGLTNRMHRNSILTDRQTILVMANFKAACSGNFINSLLSLAEFGKSFYKFIFMFPLCDDGSECGWTDYIRKHGYEVILYNEHLPKEQIKDLLFRVIRENRIDLIHNHFSCLDDICLWDKELHSMVKILYHDHMDYVAETPVKPQLKKQIKQAADEPERMMELMKEYQIFHQRRSEMAAKFGGSIIV